MSQPSFNKPLRIAFMGTPDFAVTALQALIASEHEVACVYSQPPRPKGRGKKVQSSPVHQLAEQHNIEVRTPLNFKNQNDIDAFQALNLDVAIVAAYGLILPKDILGAPQYGCLNIHASLLPRWRGAAPIHHAIWSGDDETGITVMQMDEGLDTLHNTLADMGGEMIVNALDQLAKDGSVPSTEQPEEGMTYASMLKKSDGQIDWNQTAEQIDRQVRALNPWPGSNIACGDKSVLTIIELQPENKKVMSVDVALNGGHLIVGNKLL